MACKKCPLFDRLSARIRLLENRRGLEFKPDFRNANLNKKLSRKGEGIFAHPPGLYPLGPWWAWWAWSLIRGSAHFLGKDDSLEKTPNATIVAD